MGRLFWKFFIAFWLAQLAAGWGAGMLVWLHDRNSQEMPVDHGPHEMFMLRTAASLLATEGAAPLKSLLRLWQKDGHSTLYAIDPTGKDLLDRPVPASTLAAVRKQVMSRGQSRDAMLVKSTDGQLYLLFAINAPHGFGRHGWMPPPPPDVITPHPEHHAPPFPWLHLFAGLLASLAFSGLLAWYVVKPIRHLRRAFDAAAAGNLEVRVQPLMGRRKDEIADLGRDFDRMTSQLQSLIGTQRKLFHDVSHELRSPLARMQTAIGLARQDPGKTEANLVRIEREAGKLDELVGELLTLARLDAGMGGPMNEEIDLNELLESIIDDAGFEAKSRGCSLECTVSGDATIHGQSALLYRAIENIIRNAIKFTAPDTVIRIALRHVPEQQAYRLSVTDRGPGVPDSDLERIFEAFYRGRDTRQNGYGLGLAIARRAIEAHGGTIRASNAPEGGLMMEMTLPA